MIEEVEETKAKQVNNSMNRAQKRRELRNIESWIKAEMKKGRTANELRTQLKTIQLKDKDGILLGEKPS